MKDSFAVAGATIKAFCENDGADFLFSHGLDHGFLDGGCKILADVVLDLMLESGISSAELFCLGRESAPIDHILVRATHNDDIFFLDGNGIQNQQEIVSNLLDELSPLAADHTIKGFLFDTYDEDLVSEAEDSGFAFYWDLDVVRKDLKQRLISIGVKKELIKGTLHYKIERDDDDEGIFVSCFSSALKNVSGKDLCIGHMHVADEYISECFNEFRVGDVHVCESHRRLGVASNMLDLISSHLNMKPIGASSFFSKDGEAFFEAYKQSKSEQEFPPQITPRH